MNLLLAVGLINAGVFEGKFDPDPGDLSRITVSSSLAALWKVVQEDEWKPKDERGV